MQMNVDNDSSGHTGNLVGWVPDGNSLLQMQGDGELDGFVRWTSTNMTKTV